MDKNIIFFESSIVVAARNHNPTILNPDFLKRHGIVDEAWIAVKVLCTEAISQIFFENGYRMTAEPQKIAISNSAPESEDARRLGDVAMGYINQLPHVNYSAVGINFRLALPFSSEEETNDYLLKNFIVSGPWKSAAHGAKSGQIKLLYKIRGSSLFISFDPGKIQIAEDHEDKAALVLFANFHRDLDTNNEEILDQMNTIIGDWEADRKFFFSMVNEIVSTNGS